MTKPMTDERLAKMRACCALLPEPGPEVVRELIGEIDRLRAEAAALISYRAALRSNFIPLPPE